MCPSMEDLAKSQKTRSATLEVSTTKIPAEIDKKRKHKSKVIQRQLSHYLVGAGIEGTTLFECHENFSGKDFKCQKINSPEGMGQLEAHVRIAKSIHIAFPVDVFLDADIRYLVFEKGYGNMHTHIKDLKFLSEEAAKALFFQMVQAVEDCHSAGIILNDMKLRRFIFSNSQKTNLCIENLDGCSLLQPGESDDKGYAKKSNPFYISPEAIRSGKSGHYKGKPSDVWSLGIILYTMLCGKYPFHDSNPVTLLSKIITGKYAASSEISYAARCLISKMLTKDPNERLTAREILHHTWFDQQEDFKTIKLKIKVEDGIQLVPNLS
ncbi:tribbles homolog 1-like isoform X2 [Artemia franciscana]|uniref:Protein kinase domain-containing protein n=1 Tax=Artemia franciscana TaxID=6661 RepID=A0AA88I3D9_ARTSF|nr:hypothetical protein QYM36_001799 [Artemia franciscana]KAK2723250.1 hypothetical protein QYM36_001799 [Artemia franciscana]KAK2723252.1 hypothetical protein QYM36_001799 [Artemia franciscana]